ncbi:MAG: TraR/DksA family transcriptional regulator, partial [Planctomycetota bacterium]
MRKQELAKYKVALLSLKQLLAKDLTSMEKEALEKSRQESSGDLSTMPVHFADISSDNFEQDLTLELMENKSEVLELINDALEKIDNGNFGECERCGKMVNKARLNALPYAR